MDGNTFIQRFIAEDDTSAVIARIAAAYEAWNGVLAQNGTEIEAAAAATAAFGEIESGIFAPIAEVTLLMRAQAVQAQLLGQATITASTQVASSQTSEAASVVLADSAWKGKTETITEGVLVESAAFKHSFDQQVVLSALTAQYTAEQEALAAAALEGAAASEVERLALQQVALAEAEAAAAAFRASLGWGSGTAALGENTAALGTNTGALLANQHAHLRLHEGMVSTSLGLTPLSIGLFAVGAALGYAAVQSISWSKTLNELQNNTAATDATMKEMSANILGTGAYLGASFEEMAVGARHIMDYGFQGAEAINILNEATKLAVSTGAEEANIAQSVSQALHQYGESGFEASKYINILYVESLRANSTVEQFSTNIMKVTGLAANIGVPFDQVTSAVSALTRELGNSAQAQTQVLNIMRFILRPTEEEAQAWDDLSRKSGDLMISSQRLGQTLSEEGLTGIFDRVRAATDKLNLSQAEMAKQSFDVINANRGGLGMFVLLTGATQDYQGGLAAAENSQKGVGMAQEALNRTMDTAAMKYERVWRGIQQMAIGLGDLMSGPIGLLADFLLAGEHQATNFESAMTNTMHKVGADSTLLAEVLSHSNAEVATSYRNLYGTEIPAVMGAIITVRQKDLTDQQRFTEASKVLDTALVKSKDQTTAGIQNYLMRQMQDLQATYEANKSDTTDWSEDQKAQYNNWEANILANMGHVMDAYELLNGTEARYQARHSEQQVIDEAVAKHLREVALQAEMARVAEEKLDRQTRVIQEAFKSLADIKPGGGTQVMLRDMTNALNQLQDLMATKGPEAAAAYAQEFLDRISAMAPETRVALDPLIQLMQEFIVVSGQNGSKAGDGWGTHFHAGMDAWTEDIQALFDKYATSADMRDLFQKLGIQTGDNYGAEVNDKVAEWFEPFKANLLKYLEAVKATANATAEGMRALAGEATSTAAALDAAGLDPARAQHFEQLGRALGVNAEKTTEYANRQIDAAMKKLNDLKTTVDKQKDLAIEEHDKAKAPKGGGGTEPAHAELTEEKRLQAVEEARAKLEALLAEAKLRTEREHLATETKKLSDLQKYWTDQLKDEQDVMKDAARAHQEGMAPLELNIRRASAALEEMRATHESVIHDMDEQIYQYDQQLLKLGHDADAALAPLKERAEAAAEAVATLQRETETTDHMYTLLKESVQDELLAFDAQAKLMMGPLDDAYKEAQANLDSVTDKYKNKLLPIEQELLKLQQEQAKLDRGKKLAEEAQEVGNLQARLANVIPGTREYYALLKARDEASGKLGRDIRVDQLTTEKEKIEKARDADVKRAQDQVKAAKDARDAEKALLDQQRDAIEFRLTAITREQELYDRQQREKTRDATEAKRVADDQLKDAQDHWDAEKKLIDDKRTALSEQETQVKHGYDEEERLRGIKLSAMEAEKNTYDQNYNDWVTTENNKLADMQTNADTAIGIQQGVVDALTGMLKDNEEAKDAVDFTSKLAAAMNDLGNAVKAADLPVKIKGVGTETSGLSTAARDAALNTLDLAGKLLTNLTPALQGMGTTTSTGLDATESAWGALFDVKGSDPKNITNKLFKAGDEGFFTHMDNKTRIAMDFSKGVWNGKLVELANTVIDGNLTPLVTSAGLAAEGVGLAMDNGIAKGITDNTGVITSALTTAISTAMDNAKKANGIESPSLRFAREVGYPISTGVAQGITQGGPHVASSLRNVLTDAIGTAGNLGGFGGGAGGGGDNITISLSGLTFTLPNVTKLPTDPNDYRQAAPAIMYAIAYEARRRGLKEIQVVQKK